ncbi:MotE family protein [Salinarimonas ramus]|uniref:Flagellar motility protein MotE, a chaperone for MotC folding n=1 Tax=Salinarimonas ramus TaxID=690164 RepID=A0A917V973_9HYPH|nr:hypothetical protein [Salinarimonas ramus]GGK52233.1 hypothetical protein GCM10011322_43980 [Salinarimonas ramus]
MDAREALRRIGETKLRLTDAVVIAAAALLLLKGVAFVAREPEPPASAMTEVPGPSVVTPEDTLPAFARVLAFARSDTPAPEVVTTGSAPDGEDEAGEGGEADAAAAAEAPPVDGLAPELLPNLRTPVSSSEAALRESMVEQRAALERRLRDLDMREELLAAAEARLEERLAIGATGGEAAAAGVQSASAMPGGGPAAPAQAAPQETPSEAMTRLVSMYEAMRPKDAARVFDRLALEVLVPIAVEMSPRRMAEVMAQMSPEAAERLTIALAMRARGMPLPGAAVPVTTQRTLPPTELQAIPLPQRN